MELNNRRLCNKYDLLNTAQRPFAETTVKWDMSKLTTRIRNKLLKWYDTGIKTNSGGQAAAIFRELNKTLRIPHLQVANGWVHFEDVKDDTYEELKRLHAASVVVYRMERNLSPWWGYKTPDRTGWFGLHDGADLSDLYTAVKRDSEAHQHLVEKAKELITTGAKIEFVY